MEWTTLDEFAVFQSWRDELSFYTPKFNSFQLHVVYSPDQWLRNEREELMAVGERFGIKVALVKETEDEP